MYLPTNWTFVYTQRLHPRKDSGGNKTRILMIALVIQSYKHRPGSIFFSTNAQIQVAQ